jgi:Aerobic-type carbon monoxide dehydrogenase, middle subunit CoxM/CutM homologs
MIPFDFEYYRPDSVGEALKAFRQLEAQGKNPVYYGGGTELISMARVGNLSFGAVIDLKSIPECRVLECDNENRLVLGSALTLSDLTESKRFPLMEKAAGRIADHTVQCKITLGGNLASTILYRETVLPLLLADSTVVVASADGLREYPIRRIFDRKLNLPAGAFLESVKVENRYINAPYFHIKKTRNEKIDYPLITASGMKVGGKLRIAFSGLLPYPFRSEKAESLLNEPTGYLQRTEKVVNALSKDIMGDLNGSAEYRKFVLKNILVSVLESMEDA